MRPAICLVPVFAALAVVLSGCGYAGEPKPPSLGLPQKVTDLSAVERGSKIVVTFQLPQDTTEGIPLNGAPDVEMRIGVAPNPWNVETWAANSDRVPVPAWQPVAQAATGGKSLNPAARILKKGAAKPTAVALSASGAAAAARQKQKAAKAAAVATAAETKAWFARTIEIDPSKYVGKAVAIGVRVHGPKGRDNGWSNIVSLEVLPVLPVPRNVHPTDGPNAVHLQWTADAPAFRIFRKLPADADWTQIGESTQPSFDDKTFDYGKTWQYYVQSVRKVGENWLESERSETITFTPVDRFPPAVPAGLVAISGARTIELSWDSVADSDLASYRVYRNGMKIADGVLKSAYSDKDVTTGTKYSYQVSAVDQVGNESQKSAAFEITME